MDELLSNLIVMCYSLYGVGHFLAFNSLQYSKHCIPSTWSRFAITLGGILIPFTLAVLSPKALRATPRFAGLWIYQALTMHMLFSAALQDHVIPLVFIALGFIFSMRYDICDPVVIGLVGCLLGFIASFVTAASPLGQSLPDTCCKWYIILLSSLLDIHFDMQKGLKKTVN